MKVFRTWVLSSGNEWRISKESCVDRLRSNKVSTPSLVSRNKEKRLDETKPYEEEFEKEKEEKEQELDSEYVVAGGRGMFFN